MTLVRIQRFKVFVCNIYIDVYTAAEYTSLKVCKLLHIECD